LENYLRENPGFKVAQNLLERWLFTKRVYWFIYLISLRVSDNISKIEVGKTDDNFVLFFEKLSSYNFKYSYKLDYQHTFFKQRL